MVVALDSITILQIGITFLIQPNMVVYVLEQRITNKSDFKSKKKILCTVNEQLFLFFIYVFQENEPQVYVAMHNQSEDSKFQYCLDCSVFPILPVLLSSVGAVLAILLGLLVAAIVIININDYRRFQQYVKQKEEAEIALQEMHNPNFKDPNQKIENPIFQQLLN